MSERKPLSEAKKRANKKWNDENLSKRYDRMPLVVPKGRKSDIEAFAKTRGESVNGMLNTFLREAMSLSEEEWKRPSEEDEGAHKTE